MKALSLNLEALNPARLPEQHKNNMISHISLGEVESAMKDLDSNKAPGPDGLNGAFIKKVVTNRISPSLSYIISASQSAFVKQRQISDSILIANEAVHSILSKQSTGVIFKLDFAEFLGCNKGTWPMQYLGAAIGSSPNNVAFWDP
ncbi:hypothetical protein POM88_039090 [Heracleum sosnowskyi]|uniref:Reverse transcriptase n=1 Tax=Heracleum sosnowskyi TaxID=360622 RepID=A0AAD8M8F9_9APIA|nr:hypothetical protein POM88_039090 [Heracleum sosnowskyi]